VKNETTKGKEHEYGHAARDGREQDMQIVTLDVQVGVP
jgi:hypothetical protein